MAKQTQTRKNKPAPAPALPKFKKGDFVKWTSQARGTTVEKVGKVVEVVKPQSDPSVKGPGWGAARDHRSYVVAVQTGRTERAQPKRYWPKVENLRAATA